MTVVLRSTIPFLSSRENKKILYLKLQVYQYVPYGNSGKVMSGVCVESALICSNSLPTNVG